MELEDNNCRKLIAKYVLRSLSIAGRSRTVTIMYFVYFLRSINNLNRTYIGCTTNLKQRLDTHNSSESVSTKDDRSWKLVSYVAFDSEEKARSFEKYLKFQSGRTFAKKRFW